MWTILSACHPEERRDEGSVLVQKVTTDDAPLTGDS